MNSYLCFMWPFIRIRDHVAYVGDGVQYKDNGLLRDIWHRRNIGTESILIESLLKHQISLLLYL